MRVALVTDGAGRAGTERHVGLLLAGLQGQGCLPQLVTSENGPLTDLARSHGVQVSLVPRSGSLRYVRALAACLRALRPEIVHAHSGRLACLAARLAGVRVIIETRHGIAERSRPLYRALPATRRWEGVKSRLAHVTVCICESDLRWTLGSGRPAGAVRLIRNGLEIPDPPLESRQEVRARLGLPAGAWVIGFVGRLQPLKAPERVLEVLDRLLGTSPDAGSQDQRWMALFCGDGPLGPALREHAARSGLEAGVRWLGEQPQAHRLMPALDLLLVPSHLEGLPFVVLEALQAGIPVLATPVGGIPEILSGPVLSGGCLAWNAGAWAATARGFREEPTLSRAWAQAGEERARAFPAEENVRQLADLYHDLHAGSRHRALGPPAPSC